MRNHFAHENVRNCRRAAQAKRFSKAGYVILPAHDTLCVSSSNGMLSQGGVCGTCFLWRLSSACLAHV